MVLMSGPSVIFWPRLTREVEVSSKPVHDWRHPPAAGAIAMSLGRDLPAGCLRRHGAGSARFPGGHRPRRSRLRAPLSACGPGALAAVAPDGGVRQRWTENHGSLPRGVGPAVEGHRIRAGGSPLAGGTIDSPRRSGMPDRMRSGSGAGPANPAMPRPCSMFRWPPGLHVTAFADPSPAILRTHDP